MSHGGKRPGAGRPKGKGPHGEATLPVRLPISMEKTFEKFIETRGFRLPLYASNVPAGSPSFASGDIDKHTDLNTMLLPDPSHSFLLKVTGDSMINAGIFDGDILVVSKKQEAVSGKIVVATIDGQATVKRLKIEKKAVFLLPENEKYKPIKVQNFESLNIAGVVTGSVRQY